MSDHRFHLHPYRGRTYFTCPECGQNTLIPYIDTEGEIQFPEYVGMCNRPSKCGYHFPPRKYFEEAKAKGIDFRLHRAKSPSSAPAPPPDPDYIDLQAIEQFTRYGMTTTLCQFLSQALDRLHPARTLADTLAMYRVGGLQDGRIIFPLIDTDRRVRSAKVMRYLYNGHRSKDKADKGRFCWLHSMRTLVPSSMLHIHGEGFSLSQAWFGSHLLPIYPSLPVAIVESEKTAILLACMRPQYIWLATGGMQNFVPDKAPSLQGRKVYVYADADGEQEWEQRTRTLIEAKLLPTGTMIPKWYAGEPEGSKRDIADLILDPASLPVLPQRAGRSIFSVSVPPSAPRTEKSLEETSSTPAAPSSESCITNTSLTSIPSAPKQDTPETLPIPPEHPFPEPFNTCSKQLRRLELACYSSFSIESAPQGYTIAEANPPSREGVAYYLLGTLDRSDCKRTYTRTKVCAQYFLQGEGVDLEVKEADNRIRARGMFGDRLLTMEAVMKDGHPVGIARCWEGYYNNMIRADWYDADGYLIRKQSWPQLTSEEYSKAMNDAARKYTWTPSNRHAFFPF